jgi:putative inorganic carbon (HCO3(-)) transporter
MNQKKIGKPVPNNPKDLKVNRDLKISYYLILLGYVVVPVFTPNFYTLDSNGPKTLALAILNLVAFIVFLSDNNFTKRPEMQSGFFKSFIGVAYTLFLAFSLLSFFNAINLRESVLNFVRIFTVFSSTYILFVIFRSNRNYLLHAAMALSFLLLFDCLTIFWHMFRFMTGEFSTIYDIKSVYLHKNILASAVFVKLPASIWLMFYSDGWKKWSGYFICLSAILATIMLSTRAFYLGLVLLLLALVSFAAVRFFVDGKRSQLYKIVRWAGLFLLALIAFILAQQFLFPRQDSIIGNTGIVSRLSTIRADESSTNARLGNWGRSLKLIRDHPVLGVGTGNWKIQVLEYENPLIGEYLYAYKNHNDFLEMTAETGIPGGLAYLSIFVLILSGFLKASLKSGTDADTLKFLFFPAFGILAYSVDAFFNFPADRPEIQALFAFYVASAAAFSMKESVMQTPGTAGSPVLQNLKRFLPGKLIASLILLLLAGAIWILFLFTQSLHYQRIVKEDLTRVNFKYSSSFIIRGFPSIPDLDAEGEPIAVNKARYLISENRNQDVINILLPDHSSPYDTRRENFLAMAYANLGMEDSAMVYYYKVLEMKPLLYVNVSKICNVLEAKGDLLTPVKLLQDYLEKNRNTIDHTTDREAWIYLSELYQKSGDLNKSMEIMDSASKYLFADTLVLQKKDYLKNQVRIIPFKDILEEANTNFRNKDYRKAITGYSEIIIQDPTHMQSYELRGMSYFFLKEYKKSIDDLTCLINHFPQVTKYYNIRGVCYLYLQDDEASCRDFKTAMDKGDAEAALNYRKYCEKK